jgi:hypothetical protein
MLRAVNPQIMKSEGNNDRNRMLRISMMASKFGFFLLSCLAIPCLFELPALLGFWLKDVPEHTMLFCSFMLISIMTDQLTAGLTSAIQATGKIRTYMIIVGSVKLLILPCAYILLRLGSPVLLVLVAYVSLEVLAGAFRIFSLHRLAGMSVKEYFDRVFKKEIPPVFFSVCICLLIVYLFKFNFRFLVTIPASIIVYLISIYYTGLCRDEKNTFDKMLKPVLSRIGSYGK